jgi:hypothetical protein
MFQCYQRRQTKTEDTPIREVGLYYFFQLFWIFPNFMCKDSI